MKQLRFMLLIRLLGIVVVAGLCSCASRPQATPATPSAHTATCIWEGRAFDRVVGYRFSGSSEQRGVVRSGWKKPDFAHLQKMKRNEAVLSEKDTDDLMDAIFGTHSPSRHFNCYDPHHIFVFFDKDRPVGAFEFCLQCGQCRAWPKEDLNVNESYDKLEALCRQLGLSVKPPLRSKP